MNERLEVHPALRYERPAYPGVPAPVDFSNRRYAPGILEEFRHGVARPLVAFGLFASLSLGSYADDKKGTDPAARHGDRDPGPKDGQAGGEDSSPEIRLLSRQEVEALVCGLDKIAGDTAVQIRGEVAGQAGFLTEEEGRQVLKAFFQKNGFSIEEGVPLADRGYDFTVDGFDHARRVGFEFVGPQNPDQWWAFQPESDLSDEEAGELELEAAKGGRAILVLDGRRYLYNVAYMGNLPSKAEVVERLQQDVRSFFVWLAEEGRLRRWEGGGE